MKPWLKNSLSLIITAVVSAVLLWGGDRLTSRWIHSGETERLRQTFGELLPAERFDPLDTTDSKTVTEAFRAIDTDGNTLGYAVTTEVRGYGGSITVHTAFEADGITTRGIRIGKHQETAGYGARITNAQFTDQFATQPTPFFLNSDHPLWKDGVYRAVAEYDESGFRDVVELTIKDGEITVANWDGEPKDGGKSKKELSRAGEYVMTETGLPWHSQAEMLELVLLDKQDPAAIVYDADTGKSDAYSGASIRISPFVKLATEALAQAGGISGTAIDGLSGATASSQAVVDAVNSAAAFLAERR